MRGPLAALFLVCCAPLWAATRLVPDGAGWRLERDGQPYLIRGVGGSGSLELLQRCGGNSVRTWGAEQAGATLDAAHALGLTVTVGLWLGHQRHGFDWHDPASLARQKEAVRAAVQRWREHPGLLMWGLGNEMEMGLEGDPALWTALEELAQLVKTLDPDHPVMTVVAELGSDKVAAIERYCPSVDVVGINSYAGAASLPERYAKAGGRKPYVVTEFGPPGTWEWNQKAEWGAPLEPTSTEKAAWYERAYHANVIANSAHCLGSYAFLWGSKQEATATWFGLLLPDGSRLAAVDTLASLWGGSVPAPRCPTIEPLIIEGAAERSAGDEVAVSLTARDAAGQPLAAEWTLTGEAERYQTGGDAEAAPRQVPGAVLASDAGGMRLRLPEPGRYRLFATVRDGRGGAATANIPLRARPRTVVSDPALSVPVLAEAGQAERWTASGFMGNTAAIALDPACPDQPHSGPTCLRASYSAGDQWGGVVWQSPANDWGLLPGGWDMTGATELSFWARGERGGEVVSFAFGLLDGETVAVGDSARAELKDVALSREWTQYRLPLEGLDLHRIKTGFSFTVAGQGQPVVFYLDDVKWVGLENPPPAVAPAQPDPAPRAILPLTVYSEPGAEQPWTPSGYMGATGNITMDPNWAERPHGGAACLRVTVAPGDWAGVVWQNPANDWTAAQPGGWDLRGARRLVFWARGERGAERISASLGLLKRGTWRDSASAELKDIALTTEWQRFSLDLAGLDLSRVKTGFCWTVGASDAPTVFYLDDVSYE